MKRRDLNRVRHMLDHAREARAMAAGRRRVDLDSDRQLELSLTRLLEIVGEAAARISDRARALDPDIPWLEISDLRNRLIHGYDSVDLDVLWDIIREDLPPLIAALEKLLSEHDEA